MQRKKTLSPCMEYLPIHLPSKQLNIGKHTNGLNLHDT